MLQDMGVWPRDTRFLSTSAASSARPRAGTLCPWAGAPERTWGQTEADPTDYPHPHLEATFLPQETQ